MLESEHIRNLPSDVKDVFGLGWTRRCRSGHQRVIQDAIRRDRALDTYERVQQRAAEELEARKNKENSDIQAQIDQVRHRAAGEDSEQQRRGCAGEERFTGWRLKKQQEEKKIAEAVGYFVTENPITTGDVNAVAAAQSKTTQRS